jgi:hypothetical protein
MNPYAAERLTKERTTEFRAGAAQRRLAGNTGRTIRHQTGWALIQIGLALVTSSARRRQHTVSPELP